jgi:hypothetical protein
MDGSMRNGKWVKRRSNRGGYKGQRRILRNDRYIHI